MWLDLTHMDAARVRERFPRIYATCRKYGVDITAEPAPVHPAAHYAMGGIRTDLDGRTTMPGLFAAGEAACTGVHGANRLASNSALEAMVLGARAGRAMAEPGTRLPGDSSLAEQKFPCATETELRAMAWRTCGIMRDGGTLGRAVTALAGGEQESRPRPGREDFELRNMFDVARLVARAALARRESRGAHYRTDYPHKSEDFHKHSRISGQSEVTFA